jgi:hypothetical protein
MSPVAPALRSCLRDASETVMNRSVGHSMDALTLSPGFHRRHLGHAIVPSARS